ncbi:MAG: pyridoxal phosphate-dependent aminotransferase [Flavobacteriales bacterium TMED191]|nr:MAG: pyridoxal phosphate-dependent aminotransferase [Flavobacteriales bacterium TMED191]
MPKISQKGKQMPESPIRKLVPFAEKAKKSGKEVLHLNIGQPDVLPPINVMQKINNFDIKSLTYSHSAGIEDYRKKLARYYQKIEPKISYNDILITTGGSEALNTIINCICDPEDEIIIPDPYYANYNGFTNSCNVNIVPILCDINNNFKLPNTKQFEEKISKKTKAILICNPGNPTGVLYSKKELKSLAMIVKKYDIFLIADEVYREFIYDNHSHYSVLKLNSIKDNTIIIDSVSKRYSMCGARIGAIISKNNQIINTALKFSQARLSPPTLGQLAAMEALNTDSDYFEKVIKEYSIRRNILVNDIRQIPGVTCPLPKGAFYCIVELPVKNAETFCQWLLESFHIENTTVMLAPANGFYNKKNLIYNQVRIAYVLESAKLRIAANIIKKGLQEYSD